SVNADGQIAESGHVQIYRVAHHESAGRYLHRRFSGKEKRAVGTVHDCGTLPVKREMDRTQYERSRAKQVRKLHANPAAADAGANKHADRLIAERSVGR